MPHMQPLLLEEKLEEHADKMKRKREKKLGLKMAVTAPFQGHFSWLHEPYLIEVAELLL